MSVGANSLLDIVVFGRASALRIASIAKPGSSIHTYIHTYIMHTTILFKTGDKIPEFKQDAGLQAIDDLDALRLGLFVLTYRYIFKTFCVLHPYIHKSYIHTYIDTYIHTYIHTYTFLFTHFKLKVF